MGGAVTMSKPITTTTTTTTDLKPPIRDMVTLIRHHHLTYDQFRHVSQQARKKVGMDRVKKSRTLPQLLTQAELQKFFDACECGSMRDVVLLRVLFYTACRVSELTHIKLDQIDWGESKVFIEQGKGGKDRYVLFAQSFALVLRAYVEGLERGAVWLFESTHRRPITERRVRQIITQYAHKAGITKRVYPHLLRHQMLTYLTASKLTDAQIQLVSGHSSKKSLEIYQHMGLTSVEADYQKAAKNVFDKVHE